MKIIYKQGSILDASEKYILHGCNAQGVMGSGVANLIKNKYPSAYHVYLASQPFGGMRLGAVTFAEQEDGKIIFNGITQKFYGRKVDHCYVDYWAIKEVMQAMNSYATCLDDYVDKPGIPSVAMPMIGAGLGGGDWDKISCIVEEESINFIPVVYQL